MPGLFICDTYIRFICLCQKYEGMFLPLRSFERYRPRILLVPFCHIR